MKLSSILGLTLISALMLPGCGGDGTDRRSESVPVTTEDVAPTISTQPGDVSTSIGASASFRVVASGGSLTYQWYGGTNGAYAAIPGARASTYSTNALRAADNGSLFYVVVTNPKGTVRSEFARMTVATDIVMPEIASQPTDVSADAGTSVALTVDASGGGLAYQWYKGSLIIPGATGATLSFPKVALSDSAAYHVMVSNKVGAINSRTAVVVVR